ncbi:DUF3069 domain-containing protein [Vibrio profundum]|uniref:DUF3069 domain-containing protein n=1 Tax=Vibrio profundum TaxID=2910247 RepID=UPI003D13D5CC
MSEATPNETPEVNLETLSTELRNLIEFEQVPEQMHLMVVSIHEASKEAVLEEWNTLPKSAQNVLDNFEQFHALVSVSQAFAGINVMEEFPTLELPRDMTEEQTENYRAELLDQVLHNCVKDMIKQVKKARRDAILKREFQQAFSGK